MSSFKSIFKPSLRIDLAKARDTGMAMVLICLIIYLWLGNTLYIKIATALLVLTMAAPIVFKQLGYLWFGLAHILGTMVSSILLFIVFLFIVTPMGLLRKLMGKDPLKMKMWKKSKESVFGSRDHLYSAQDIDKPY